MKIQIYVTQPALVEVSLTDGVLTSAITPFDSHGLPIAAPFIKADPAEQAAKQAARRAVAAPGPPPAPIAPTIAFDDTPDYMRDVPPVTAPSVEDGTVRFAEFVAAWSVGFGAPLDGEGGPTVVQPNRRRLMKLTMAQHGRAIFAFIGQCGDLRAAIRSVMPEHAAPEGHTYAEYTDALAGNIVQIASLDCPPLANTIKYTAADDRTIL